MPKNSNPNLILRNRCIITFLILIIIRIGTYIPIPGVSQYELFDYVQTQNLGKDIAGVVSNNANFTIGIFNLSIYPYINASILFQVLTYFQPELSQKQKDGDLYNRIDITRYLRWITVLLAIIESVTVIFYLKNILFNWNWFFAVNTLIWLTTGSLLILWLAERISIYGIGNGISLLVYDNIISNFTKVVIELNEKKLSINSLFIFGIIIFLTIAALIVLQQVEKKVPLISAKSLGNTRMTKETRARLNYLPLKINQSGVMPIILTTSVLIFPKFVISKLGLDNFLNQILLNINNSSEILSILSLLYKIGYGILYFYLIFLFDSFYSTIILDPKDLAKELQTAAVSIVGIRSGTQTTYYLTQTKKRLNFIGSIFLSILTAIPNFIEIVLNISSVREIGIGPLIITVGTFFEIFREIDNLFWSDKNVYKE